MRYDEEPERKSKDYADCMTFTSFDGCQECQDIGQYPEALFTEQVVKSDMDFALLLNVEY